MQLLSKVAGAALTAAAQSAVEPTIAGGFRPTRPGFGGSPGSGAVDAGLLPSGGADVVSIAGPFGSAGTPTKPTPPRNPHAPKERPAAGQSKLPTGLEQIAATVRDFVAAGATQFTVNGPKGRPHAIDTTAQTSNGRPWSQRAIDWFSNLGSGGDTTRSNVVQTDKGGPVTAASQTVLPNVNLGSVNLGSLVTVRPAGPRVTPPPPIVRPAPTAGGNSGSSSGTGGSGGTGSNGGATSSGGSTTTSTTTGGGSSAGSGNSGTDTTGTTGNSGLDSTLADIFSSVFGSGVGFTPQTSDSGGQVLVVPGEGAADSGGGNAVLGLFAVVAVAGVAYYVYKRRKGAANG